MEALRAAGRAVLRSPSLARHRLGVARLRRHQLPESWSDMREPLLEGMGFALKYLGMTLVEKPKGEDMASAAIHRILATARVGPKKFRKVILTVSPRGLSLQDAETKETIETISIYRQAAEQSLCLRGTEPPERCPRVPRLSVAQEEDRSREGEGEKKPSLSPLCPPVENTRPPGRSPLGSPPFKTNFEEEEEEDEEEEEEEDLNEAFSGCGGACVWGLPSCPLPVSGGLGLQPPQQLPASGDIFLRLLLLIFLLPLTVSSLLISSTASAAPCLSPTRTSCPHP
ncbi:uncharacterized protein LOC114595047 isoform X8 [Podarcis muralis]